MLNRNHRIEPEMTPLTYQNIKFDKPACVSDSDNALTVSIGSLLVFPRGTFDSGEGGVIPTLVAGVVLERCFCYTRGPFVAASF